MINSEGARLTGGRWNRPGTAVIYASDDAALAAMEVIVHHGGIPQDYIGIRIDVPDDLEIGTLDIPDGWPDLVPEEVTADLGTKWANTCKQAVLRVPSATMSLSGYNYVLNPAHSDFTRISFSFEPVRFDPRLRRRV
ncbi:MAG: RES domain-containing protein [Bryobacterales bacterium]|nr:RES domain-containing protein [Bryobacterales bacterium]